MKQIETKCPGCNSSLELDLDKLIAYCPYCGTKLTIDIEVLAEVLKEREKTKRTSIKSSIEEKAIEQKNIEAQLKHKQIILFALLPFVGVLILFIMWLIIELK